MSTEGDALVVDVSTLTDEELAALADEVSTERSRRWALATAQERAAAVEAEAASRLDEIAASFHGAGEGAGTVEAPVEYVPPTGAHDAWPRGAVVAHAGKVWRSLVPANVTTPGEQPGRWWAQVEADDPDPTGPAAWAGGTYYRVGDLVERLGVVYSCTHEHLAAAGWEPESPTMHAVWQAQP